MSDEQINIAIAEACGWKEIQSSHAPVEFGRRPHGWKRTEHGIERWKLKSPTTATTSTLCTKRRKRSIMTFILP